MKSSLLNKMQENDSLTENQMPTHSTTGNQNVNLFFKIGAIRNRNESDIEVLLDKAFQENPLYAMKIVFHGRDILEGKGERRVFRIALRWLAQVYPDMLRNNVHLIPEYGRFDDLIQLFDTPLEADALDVINNALSLNNGLAAKWLPRKDKKKDKIKAAKKIREYMELTPKQYRKLLVELTDVVENKMCANRWQDINLSHVPSIAASKYKKAFHRRIPEKFTGWVKELQKPKSERDPNVKVNTKAIYPHDIISDYFKKSFGELDQVQKDAIEVQWNELPNWLKENGGRNILPVCDTSGSMFREGTPKPIQVSVSLGIYLAERNEGLFKDHFITFSENPELQEIKGSKLESKIKDLKGADWGMNTNLMAVFKLILNKAKENKIPQKEMPDMILILSDMEFDRCTRNRDHTAMQSIKEMYNNNGYEVPDLVFWNLQARNDDNHPVKYNETGAALISGFSPSIMKSIISNPEEMTPENIMLQTINSERYKDITV